MIPPSLPSHLTWCWKSESPPHSHMIVKSTLGRRCITQTPLLEDAVEMHYTEVVDSHLDVHVNDFLHIYHICTNSWLQMTPFPSGVVCSCWCCARLALSWQGHHRLQSILMGLLRTGTLRGGRSPLRFLGCVCWIAAHPLLLPPAWSGDTLPTQWTT